MRVVDLCWVIWWRQRTTRELWIFTMTNCDSRLGKEIGEGMRELGMVKSGRIVGSRSSGNGRVSELITAWNA